MTAVAVNQEMIVTADDCFCFRGGRTVNIAVFSEYVVVSYFQKCGFSLILEILSLETNDSKWEEFVAFSESGRPTDDNMTVQYAAFSEFDVRTDYAVRPYRYVVRQFCGGVNNCCGVNLSHNCILSSSGLGFKQKIGESEKNLNKLYHIAAVKTGECAC